MSTLGSDTASVKIRTLPRSPPRIQLEGIAAKRASLHVDNPSFGPEVTHKALLLRCFPVYHPLSGLSTAPCYTINMKKVLAGTIVVLVVAFFLNRVFSGQIILPQYFHVGPLTIHYYGIIIALAAASAFYLAVRRAPRYGVELKQAEDILFWVIVGGFIGARLYHIFSSIGYYWVHPIDVFKVWNGGLSIYGAVLGGIITLWALKRIFNFSAVAKAMADKQFLIFNLLDWLAPSVVLGQIIGRFGNLFNYEAYGYATNLPWKMFVPLQFRLPPFWNLAFYHPWFLYEALGNTIILLILLRLSRSRRPAGWVVFSYLLLYNALRFSLEFLRIDSTFLGPLRLNALASLVLVLVSAGCLIFLRNAPTT